MSPQGTLFLHKIILNFWFWQCHSSHDRTLYEQVHQSVTTSSALPHQTEDIMVHKSPPGTDGIILSRCSSYSCSCSRLLVLVSSLWEHKNIKCRSARSTTPPHLHIPSSSKCRVPPSGLRTPRADTHFNDAVHSCPAGSHCSFWLTDWSGRRWSGSGGGG